MSRPISSWLCLIALLGACNSADQGRTIESSEPITDDDGGAATGGGSDGVSGGTNGGATTGTTGDGGATSGGTSGATSGGASGATSGGASGATSGGTSGATSGGTNGSATMSKCGAPLDAAAPTAASVGAAGPFKVKSYSSGLLASQAYRSLNVFYPDGGTGPFVVVMLSPGLTEGLSALQGWANRFASHGYVAVFVEANNTGSLFGGGDSSAVRAEGTWAAIASIKAENARADSPLKGKVSDCFVASGHSLGGGASLLTAQAHPTELKAVLGFNPYEDRTEFTKIVAPTLILTGERDDTAGPAAHGRRQYNTIPASVSKLYVEATGGNHQSALFVTALPSQYAVSWVKYIVDGDARYRPFLDEAASGLSDFATTLP